MISPRSEPARLPDVAVLLITYNHEAFIAESIEGVLEQEYPGTIHFLVSDDCSTDETRRVIIDAIANPPENVIGHPRLRDENGGGLRNLTEGGVWANATGAAYISLLEGDDYWTDRRKLALQVGHMEVHERTTLSFALANELILFDGAPPPKVVVVPPNPNPNFGDLLRRNFIHTCTVVYRQGVLPHFPEWFAECAFRDWPLHLAHASTGELHFLDQIVAVHRQHESSRWWNPANNMREQARANEKVQRLAIAHLGTKHNFRRAHVAVGRHRTWAWASENRPERWLHLAAAAALEPAAVIRRRLKRHASLRLRHRPGLD